MESDCTLKLACIRKIQETRSMYHVLYPTLAESSRTGACISAIQHKHRPHYYYLRTKKCLKADWKFFSFYYRTFYSEIKRIIDTTFTKL